MKRQSQINRCHCAVAIPVQTMMVVALAFFCLLSPAQADFLRPLPVKPEQKPCILLEAEHEDKKSGDAPKNLQVCYAELVEHNAGRAFIHGNALVLRKAGHAHSSATLRYKLPEDVLPGEYLIWTSFTLGGVATQTFSFRIGSDTDHLTQRTSFNQSNRVSWKTEWRRGSARLKVYPGDRYLEIQVKGMASQQKQVDAFLLVLAERLPENVTLETATWRAATDSLASLRPDFRIYILESQDGRDADSFFKLIATQMTPAKKERLTITTFIGNNAADLAESMQLKRLPAMMIMDDRYALRGVLIGKVTEKEVAEFVSSSMTTGRATGPFLKRARHFPEKPKPLQNGSPRAWLVVDKWGGPAGFSLWGIEAEPRLRPNPGEPVTAIVFDSRRPTEWAQNQTTEIGMAVINPSTGDYSWARGVGYAHVFLHAEEEMDCLVHTSHTGFFSAAWLDGHRVSFEKDPAPPAAFSGEQETEKPTVTGINDQGGKVRVTLGKREAPRLARLKMTKGWHRLLLKFVMQHGKDRVFSFAARFTDEQGHPTKGLRTQLSDPKADHELRADATRLKFVLNNDAPSNLVYPGRPLKLRFDLRWQRIRGNRGIVMPIIPFDAKLELAMTDYDGKEIERREIEAQFPAALSVDFGKAPETGYYALQATLFSKAGKVILVCPPDGFSVIRGAAAQYARRDTKEMAVTYYFMGSGERATYRKAFPWMTRMGIYRNIGSSPGFPLDMAEEAKELGIALTMDFWDIHSAYTQQARQDLAKKAAPHTRWFKSFNEVDIHHRVRKTPEHWVSRTKGEYESVKAARPDGIFVGGSLVRPGTDDWFTSCIKLGLDKYIDVWDVHAYPQRPPTLGGTLSNSPNETELGVFTCYKRAGMKNAKPFWIGETGARACHGFDARRWQADTIAKMVACVCSREDFQYIGFLWPWTYARGNDIVTAHMPGEAAYYTVSALIDGFPYTRLDVGDRNVQAAIFGKTRMLWRTRGSGRVRLPLRGTEPWVIVDVVGRVREFAVDEDGHANLKLTGSPVYVLTKADYERLTAFE